MAASSGEMAFLSSMKSPRWLSSSSPMGVSSEIGSLAILRILRTLSSGRSIFSAISSLDVGTTMSADPVDDFLFTRKTGYCEHYATAMVVLLRALGIPARLVTGFLPGVWNDFGNYYTIRQQDAHAWVEVYFPLSGWVTFAPTPSVPAAVPSWVWWNIRSEEHTSELQSPCNLV